jgi:anti-sigma factor RsiW
MTEPDPADMSDLAEREVLFNAYLDGDLCADREEAFDRRLEQDPDFREAYEQFAEVVGQVQNLPYEFAPDDFTDRVEERIRTRSNGRFFGEQLLAQQRSPYEAVAVVMLIVMSSTYIFMGIPPDRGIGSEAEKRLEIPPQRTPHRPQTRP